MYSPVLFVGGQVAIAIGAYLLSKSFPWTVVVGLWLVVEGLITVVMALLSAHRETEAEPWHGGAADEPQ